MMKSDKSIKTVGWFFSPPRKSFWPIDPALKSIGFPIPLMGQAIKQKYQLEGLRQTILH